MSRYRAEYLWIDGTEPSALIRSKTKVIPTGEEPGIWGFDGSSTNQAPGENSDCVLQPVFVCPDPIRGGDNVLVLCEVLLTDMTPHATNHRAPCAVVAEKYNDFDIWFGIEQEYTFFNGDRPLGFPEEGFPGPQGPVLLRRRGGRSVRARNSRSAHGSVHRRGARHLRHERRGDAGPVGVSDWASRPARVFRPSLGGTLAPLPHRRGLRCFSNA